MMEHMATAALPVVIMVMLIPQVICTRNRGLVSAHCTQTARDRLDSTPRKLVPSQANETEFPEPPIDAAHLNLGLCPDSSFLKISWIIEPTHGSDVKLCYRMKSLLDGQLLFSKCVKLHVQGSEQSSAMDCWFPMEFMSQRPIINVWAAADEPDRTRYYYGNLNTAHLDSENSCKDICEVTALEINTPIYCHNKASIFFDPMVTVQQLSFDGINTTTCTDSLMRISRQTSSKLEYFLGCEHSGLGHVKVLYIVKGKYCLMYQMVRVVCDIPKGPTMKATPRTDHVDSFETFVMFGVACMLIISAVIVLTIFVVQRLKCMEKVCWKHPNVHRERGRNTSNCCAERIPLNSNNTQSTANHDEYRNMEDSIPPSVEKVIKQEYKKREDSAAAATADGQENIIPKRESIRGRQSARKLHRSHTISLLENTKSFYRKKVLFLPTPFDIFSRDVANLLKTVLMLEGHIPSQCCFDRDVSQPYMYGNRYKWIETVLGDYDKILIFLCFTTLGVETRSVSMVDDILEHLLLSRTRPHCKVAFLHLTDKSDDLEGNHHGDSFHLSNMDSYIDFLAGVLKYCGRDSETESDLMDRLINCETSKHFLRLVGINNIK